MCVCHSLLSVSKHPTGELGFISGREAHDYGYDTQVDGEGNLYYRLTHAGITSICLLLFFFHSRPLAIATFRELISSQPTDKRRG